MTAHPDGPLSVDSAYDMGRRCMGWPARRWRPGGALGAPQRAARRHPESAHPQAEPLISDVRQSGSSQQWPLPGCDAHFHIDNMIKEWGVNGSPQHARSTNRGWFITMGRNF